MFGFGVRQFFFGIDNFADFFDLEMDFVVFVYLPFWLCFSVVRIGWLVLGFL